MTIHALAPFARSRSCLRKFISRFRETRGTGRWTLSINGILANYGKPATLFRLELYIYIFNSLGFVDQPSMASWSYSRSCKFIPCSTTPMEISRKNLSCRLSRKKRFTKFRNLGKDFFQILITPRWISKRMISHRKSTMKRNGERSTERLDRWFGVWERGRCSSSVRHFIQKKNTIRHGGWSFERLDYRLENPEAAGHAPLNETPFLHRPDDSSRRG